MSDGITPMHWKTKLYAKLFWELDGCETVAVCNRGGYGMIFVSVRRPSGEPAPVARPRPAKRKRRAVVPSSRES